VGRCNKTDRLFCYSSGVKAEIYWIETPGPGRLAIMPRPRAGDWLEDEIRSLREDGVDVLVSLLEAHEVEELELGAEEATARAAGLEFLSHPIPDHDVPTSFEEAVAFLRTLVARLEAGKGVAIHCRAGIGRSATLAAGSLLLRGMAMADVLERMEQARGFPVPETPEQHEWLARLAGPAA
jgi:protein-tyrosine phosphatase